MTVLLESEKKTFLQICASGADEGEELVAGLELCFEDAQHGRGDCGGVLFFYTAHHHAEVFRLEDDGYSLRIDGFGNGIGDLTRQTLLHLKPAGEYIDEAWNFAEADDLAVRDVGYMRFAEEWQQVVLAHGIELDVLDDDHLVVVDVEEGFVEYGVDIDGSRG